MSITDIATSDYDALISELCPFSPDQALTANQYLRSAGHEPHIAASILTQAQLRTQAEAKFGQAAHSMMFTRAGYEQSTRATIAQSIHAQHLADSGATHVIDVGCGIGADSRAFASAGLQVTAIEKDHETASAARWNLKDFPHARVIEADAWNVDLDSLNADALWIDPARRINGTRIQNPERWIPSLPEALNLASQFPCAGIKIAPGIDYSWLPPTSHTQWVSDHGNLLEALIWLGSAAAGSGRTAALCSSDGTVTHWNAGVNDPSQPAQQLPPAPLSTYLIEPDPAIIRCGGIAAFAQTYNLAPVSSAIAYLTGLNPAPLEYAQVFEVLDVLPLNAKKIGAYLNERRITHVEIKKRGTDITPERLRAQLKLRQIHNSSSAPATLILTPVMGKHQAVLARRIDSAA